MTGTYSQAYAEILEIIGNMEQNYQDKIPAKLIKFFEENKDSNYKYNIVDEISEKQNMAFSQKTIDLLAMLELKYLATETEKELLKDALDKNEIKYQEELHEKYNPNNIFKDKTTKLESVNNSVSMVEHKESIFTKIKNWFNRLFNK